MAGRAFLLIFLFLFPHGCSGDAPAKAVQLKYKAAGQSPTVLALYEAWFGYHKHIPVGYSSDDPAVLRKQIHEAKGMGISAFVVDWYGNRDLFIDKNYALLQTLAAKNQFQVAMMYEESKQADGATDEAIADLTMFHDVYLSEKASGREAYLTYQGRPVIFIFPAGKHTDWNKVRAVVNKWNPAPFLIDENLPGQYAEAFDGFYAWINPGPKGWAADGSSWGEEYLDDFYKTMASKFPDKIIVGGAWASFDDSKASWGINRHISARCGQTYRDTFNFWRKYFPADQPIPFMMIQTWNDYEEGSAIEPGLPTCDKATPPETPKSQKARPLPSP